MTLSFEDSLIRSNMNLIFQNMELIVDVISRYDIRELVEKNVNILAMMLSNETTRKILYVIRNIRDMINWDNDIIYDLIVELLKTKNKVILGPRGQIWLKKQIEYFEKWIFT